MDVTKYFMMNKSIVSSSISWGSSIMASWNNSVDMTALHSVLEPQTRPQLLVGGWSQRGTWHAVLAGISELKVGQATASIPLIPKPINTCFSQLETSQCHRETARIKGLLNDWYGKVGSAKCVQWHMLRCPVLTVVYNVF